MLYTTIAYPTRAMKLLLLSCALIFAIEGTQLPSNFKKCNRKDADFQQCLFDAVQDALPQLDRPYDEINLPNFKPRFVDQFRTRSKELLVDIDEHLYNCTIYGFTDGKLQHFLWDLDKKVIEIELFLPQMDSYCTYRMQGRFFVLPIDSSGPDHLIYQNFVHKFYISYVEDVRDGQTYVNLVNSTYDASTTNVHFQLDNIIPGSKLLSTIANLLANLTWFLVYESIKENYWENVNEVLRPLFRGFFDSISLEELFD